MKVNYYLKIQKIEFIHLLSALSDPTELPRMLAHEEPETEYRNDNTMRKLQNRLSVHFSRHLSVSNANALMITFLIQHKFTHNTVFQITFRIWGPWNIFKVSIERDLPNQLSKLGQEGRFLELWTLSKTLQQLEAKMWIITSGQELILSINFIMACCRCIGLTLVWAAISYKTNQQYQLKSGWYWQVLHFLPAKTFSSKLLIAITLQLNAGNFILILACVLKKTRGFLL